MDMFQSQLLFIVNELKQLQIHLSPDEYFKIQSKNSWSYALIGDLHARTMWENLPIQSIPEDDFDANFYGNEDLTANRLYSNEDNYLEDAINWGPDFAVLVCGSNDLVRNEDLGITGATFADRILQIYQRLQRNNITCFVLSMCERYENPNAYAGRKVFREGSVITQSIYHHRSSSTNNALKNSLPKGRYIHWPSDLRPAVKYCDGVHLYPEGYRQILDSVGTYLKTVTRQALRDECDEALYHIRNSNLEVEEDILLKEDEDKNEMETEIKQAAFPGSDSDEIKYIDKSNTELFNLSGNRNNTPELCKDTMSQSDSNDSSDYDDDLEDLFSAVGASLTAAENNDKKSQADFSNKENEKYLSGNDSEDDEERNNRKTKFQSERFVSSSQVPSNSSLKDVLSDVSDIPSNDSEDDEERNNKKTKFERERFVSSSQVPSNASLKDVLSDVSEISSNDSEDDEERNNKKTKFERERLVSDRGRYVDGEKVKGYRIPGLCNKYNNLENCKVTPCRLPHKCDECGGEHPRRNCIKKDDDENLFTIPGMCFGYNVHEKCKRKQCKWPHRCDECGGGHPRKKCTIRKQSTPRLKGKDRSPRRDSRSRSPVHSRSNYFSEKDESLSWQHQPFSVPPPQASAASSHQHLSQSAFQSNYPHVSQSDYQSNYPLMSQNKYQSVYPHVSKSGYQSNYPHVSQNDYQSDYPHVPKSDYQSKISNTSDINKSVLSGVVDTVAKLTLNKGTSFIIEQINKEIEILRIPSTMEIIGKLILEISEKHESLLSGVVEKVAKLTLNKDTFCIIEQIKKELENLGIPATMEIIGKLVLEISEQHEKMNVMKGDISVDYGRGSSSNPINESSESIGYGQPNWNQSSGMPSQQITGHMYQSSGNNHPGNAWFQSTGSAEPNSSGMPSQQVSGNMGNMLCLNVGNDMIYHNQWNQGFQGTVPGMQVPGWSQGQGPSGVLMLPHGHISVKQQGNLQGQGLSQGVGNAGVPSFQGHSNEVSRPMNSNGYNASSYNKKIESHKKSSKKSSKRRIKRNIKMNSISYNASSYNKKIESHKKSSKKLSKRRIKRNIKYIKYIKNH